MPGRDHEVAMTPLTQQASAPRHPCPLAPVSPGPRLSATARGLSRDRLKIWTAFEAWLKTSARAEGGTAQGAAQECPVWGAGKGLGATIAPSPDCGHLSRNSGTGAGTGKG
jgi:hypothetical protein